MTRQELFQSTLPQRERHNKYTIANAVERISIHTPTKGATAFKINGTSFFSISIHTPTKGATRQGYDVCMECEKFQSTLPQRERLDMLNKTSKEGIISIHTPTKGATPGSLQND